MAAPYNYTNDSINLEESTLNISALTTDALQFNTFGMNNGVVNIGSSDVDFETNTMGRITADEYNIIGNGNTVNLNGINLLNKPDTSIAVINIPFADESFASSVKYSGQESFETSIYKYGIAYNPKDGNMMFIRGGQYNSNTGSIEYPSNPSDQFNPSVMSTTAATQAGAVSTMIQTYNYAFQHSEHFMSLPNMTRMALLNKNKYALATSTAADVSPDADICFADNAANAWYKPYVSFESVPLKNGPKVSSITYGSLAGYDTPIKELRNGWSRTWSGYVGYNGAHQSYGGVSSYQNGGLLGGTLTMYKGNLFNATSLNVGASVSETSSMFGHDNATMLLAGVANRTGYNFEYKQGKYIVQPNLFVSYSFVNTFDYTNAAGVKISSDPLHSIQVAPGLRLMMNTKNGWQPYIAMNMVWNILDKSRVTADSVRLPEASVKPYFQYGVGLQKHFNDDFMAFGQVMVQNGGRNGVSLTAGLRWAVGQKDKHEKVQNDTKVVDVSNRKVIKQIDVAKKTSMTNVKGVVKQI
jgi:outer membrane autotransporter protein